ncbi:MAG: hypothetical protein Q7T55_14850 [Solirubrobacteraceae bacterium]|nr:hypothetical protein [Solirubrobacteraceae bacterium]
MSRLLPLASPATRRTANLPGVLAIRRGHTARLVAALAVLFAVLAAIPTAASARTYVIRQCNDGAGHGVEVTSGFVQLWENRTASDGCPGGGTLSFNMPDNTLAPFGTNGQSMGYSFILPAAAPNLRITGASAQLTIPPATMDPNLSSGDFSIHSEGPAVTTDAFHHVSSWGGLPNVARSADLANPSRFVRFLLWCYAPCNFRGTPAMQLGATTITIDDPRQPEAPTFESSGLLDASAQKGTKTLRFGVDDGDSGIRRIELRTAAGAQLASTADGQGCSYTRPIPCPQERLQESFTLDTTRLPDGKHTLSLWVTDAAGTVAKTALPAITVQNAAAAVATPTPAPTQPSGATPAPTPKATPGPGTGVTGGTGTTGGGSAVGGTTPGTGGPAATPPAAITTAVAFKVSSKTPRRGARVTFSGVVTPVPAAAGRVMIEAKSGKKWITAAVVRTREGGAFTWSHAFSRRGTFTMRARLLTSVEEKTKPSVSPKRTFRVR